MLKIEVQCGSGRVKGMIGRKNFCDATHSLCALSKCLFCLMVNPGLVCNIGARLENQDRWLSDAKHYGEAWGEEGDNSSDDV